MCHGFGRDRQQDTQPTRARRWCGKPVSLPAGCAAGAGCDVLPLPFNVSTDQRLNVMVLPHSFLFAFSLSVPTRLRTGHTPIGQRSTYHIFWASSVEGTAVPEANDHRSPPDEESPTSH
jgi:hypothetical protein